MLELRPLRQFLVLAEELHFGRAAKRLHITQPPLTIAIRQLERTWGVTLFHRTQRAVALSPAGQALLPLARRLLEDAERIPAAVQAAERGELGRLRLGFVSTIGFGGLPRWLAGFRKRWPQVELALREATLDVQLQAFSSGQLDLGFALHAPGACPSGFDHLTVAHEALVLALSAEHPMAQQAPITLAQALEEPLLIFPRAVAPSLFDGLLAFYRQHHHTPRLAQEATQMQTLVNLVSAGMGVAWVPESVMQLQRPGVVYRRLDEWAPRCETSLIWQTPVTAVVQRFVDHVAQALGQTGDAGPDAVPVLDTSSATSSVPSADQ